MNLIGSCHRPLTKPLLPDRRPVNAPSDWGSKKLTRIALSLYDAVFLLGPRINYEDWRGQFRRNLGESPERGLSVQGEQPNEVANRRNWERWKRELRLIEGLTFELDHGPYSDADLPQGLVFLSSQHVFEVVDALIGPADPETKGLPTVSVFDLFPREKHEDVEALIEALATDLVKRDGQEVPA